MCLKMNLVKKYHQQRIQESFDWRVSEIKRLHKRQQEREPLMNRKIG